MDFSLVAASCCRDLSAGRRPLLVDQFGGDIGAKVLLSTAILASLSLCSQPHFSTEQGSPTEAAFVEGIIPANYSRLEAPPLINGSAIPVLFSVSVKNIPDINELQQDISVEMNLRIYWIDRRLNVDQFFADGNPKKYVSISPIIISKMWVPDVYTDYTKDVIIPRILTQPASLRIYPNHTVRYSARITMKVACPMDFKLYPADTQICDIRIESYAYTRDMLTFAWRPEGNSMNIARRLPHFDHSLTFIGDRDDTNFPSGSYPAITMSLVLRRRVNYHVLQTYVPSGLFVIVSWLSFLVPRESVPGRMAICMTTLLTLTAMFAAVRQSTPSVSYIKALDIWMVTCIICVFFTLVEYATVLRIDQILKKKAKDADTPNAVVNERGRFRSLTSETSFQANKPNTDGDMESTVPVPVNGQCTFGSDDVLWKEGPTKRTLKAVEYGSAILIPLAFVVFNIFYWPWLLVNRT